MMVVGCYILALALVTYALHVPVDSNPCVFFPLIYPSLLTYLFSASDPSVPHTLMVAQPHAGRFAVYTPTSRKGARQNICSQYGTPHDPTQYSCLAPTCINTGNGFCSSYCGNTLTPCSGACPSTSCGPAARDSFQIQGNLLVPPWILSASSTPPLSLMISREFYQRFKPA